MKLMKQEWCVAVMAGCMAGLAGSAVVLAQVWLAVNRPVLFWQVVIVALMAALCVMYKRAWRPRARRQELWICQYCGKLHPLEEHIAHRCER
jgi:membrane protein implicated in regulation of membrane protease activity